MSIVPNLLTMLRIALIPLILYFSHNEYYSYALAIFLIAGVTDALDGIIAKRFNCSSETGAVLDPTADKLLLVSTFLMLSWMELIPWWVTALVVTRDIMVVCGFLAISRVHKESEVPKPTRISKANTFLQITLILLVLTQAAQILTFNQAFIAAGFLLISASTTLAGVQALLQLRLERQDEQAKPLAPDSQQR